MAILQRYQNLTQGNTAQLNFYVFNANLPTDVIAVNSVSIFFLDPIAKTPDNLDGRTLIQTIDGSQVIHDSTGVYHILLPLTIPQFVIGQYLDVWNLQFDAQESPASQENHFQVVPNLWYSSVSPIIYGFSFNLNPNRIKAGSKQFISIEIVPMVPRQTDLIRYYTNLAILGNLTISIAESCQTCASDLDSRTIVDNALVDYREKVFGYYQIDTTEATGQFPVGLYEVTVQLAIGSNIYVSDIMNLQVI